MDVNFKDRLIKTVLECVSLLYNTLRHIGGLERDLHARTALFVL